MAKAIQYDIGWMSRQAAKQLARQMWPDAFTNACHGEKRIMWQPILGVEWPLVLGRGPTWFSAAADAGLLQIDIAADPDQGGGHEGDDRNQ